MKRALLIAGGTVGGLGAVLAITPPQLSNNSTSLGGGIELAPATTTTSEATTAPAATATATSNPKPATTKSAKPNAGATKKPTAAATATASATAATQSGSTKAMSGTFLGDPSTMRYGTVQVQITINGGNITDAQAVRVPTGENQRYTDRAIPIMRQNTLAAQSSNITGVSGASYTAYAWYVSLQSALKKAGWM